jgi:hypothetical protein
MEQMCIGLILIQIEEAHTTKWPLGFVDHPPNHATFEDRIERANEFGNKFPQFKNVYVDSWTNDFEHEFQAWPDRFVLVDENLVILEKSEYSMEAVIIRDYANIIESMVENK